MDAIEILSGLIDRGNAELILWAIERYEINLADVWPDLGDEDRDGLVELSVVAEVQCSAECTDAESWSSGWQTECGAAWPDYDLEITAEGMPTIEVTGWHCVGYHSSDYKHGSERWGETDDDGSCNGLPRVNEWNLRSGDNVGTDSTIPCWRLADGRWVTLDRDNLKSAIRDAAAQADHGGEPSWEDVTIDDRNRSDDESVWVIEDGKIIEVEIWHGGIAPRYEDRHGWSSRQKYTYGAEAWGFRANDKDEVYETRDDIIAAVREEYGTVYGGQGDAEAALTALVEEMADELPDGLELTSQNGRLVIVSIADISPGEVAPKEYEMDCDDMGDVIRDGWDSLLRRELFVEGDGVFQTSDGRAYLTPEGTVIVGEHSWRMLSIRQGDTWTHPKVSGNVLTMIWAALKDRDALTDAILADALEETGDSILAQAAAIIRAALEIVC